MSQTDPSPLNSFPLIQVPSLQSYKPQTSIVKSIPIVRTKLQYSSKLIQKLPIYGPKYISRIAASSQKTSNVLRKIKNTTNLKLVYHLDFDNYFSQASGLPPLCKVLPRLRHDLQKMDLTIRKIETENETNVLYPYIYRMDKVTKIRIELFNLDGMDGKGITKLAQAFQKCYLLKELEIYLTCLVKVGHQGFQTFSQAISKMQKLERLKFHIKTAYDPQWEQKEVEEMMPTMKHIKDLDLLILCKTGWMSIKDRINRSLPLFFKSIPHSLNPTKLSISLLKMPLSVEAISELANALPQISNLRTLVLELGSSMMQEFEFGVLFQGLSKCKQIDHLIFKCLEVIAMPLRYMAQFYIMTISHLPMPETDLYYRKIEYDRWEKTETEQVLNGLEHTTYTLTKHSLHLHKKSN